MIHAPATVLISSPPIRSAAIEIPFAGYNLYNDIDVLVFKEVLNTDSVGYVRTFFNRLCKKLEKESERIGLR